MDMKTAIARPLGVLVPLIRTELEGGDKAGSDAARPFHEQAGAHLIEAAAVENDQTADEFWEWATETFDRPRKILRAHMELAWDNNVLEIERAHFPDLAAFMRSKNKIYANRRGGSDVHDATKESLKGVDKKAYSRPKGKLVDERKLQNKLALELIDIGYKALAVKLHPDKQGGSKEAMRRLNDVRTMLKKLVNRR